MADDDYLSWIDTQKTIKADVDYHDATPTPPLVITPNSDLMEKAQTSAEQLETKMFGHDVRATLAQWVLLGGYLYQQNIITLQQYAAALDSFTKEIVNRQTAVEQRQTNVESDFKNVIANATVDSEVILARSSKYYGSFNVIDDRLEYIEGLLAQAVPGGFAVKINHNLNCHPKVLVKYYEYAIGTEPNGLGTYDSFGGTVPKEVVSQVQYDDADNITVQLPIWFKLNGIPVQKPDGNWYLIDDYKTLCFDLGPVNDATAAAGDSSQL
ncbi:hypothetical protein AB0Y04_04750 [Loigolactobacillus coryniformis]|uniref:hypothetical protein n=1 Tax=Loigolactobacillus coryniformis TaxID=1610 RepID=UPI003F277494